MRKLPRNLVIVGGGTAGWLAALMLGDVARRGKEPVSITVIESSKLGTIGVGEGTTAAFRQMLKHLCIDEMEFIRETGATIKYGIRHKDWRRVGHSYDGPIDDPSQVVGAGLDTYAVANSKPVTEAHLFQHLINRKRAPFAERGGKLISAGPYHFAYHFDQSRAGAYLKKQAKGVSLIDDQVTGVEVANSEITALQLESGQRVEGDFFLDCTGFRRALIGELGAKWVDYGDVLPVNRAMPFWLDFKPDEEILPATVSHALGNGWMWQIPTQDRMGCGYVYSDAHISSDEAQAEVEKALGHAIEPRNDIKIDAGRLADAWIGNCVAVGLASSFLEPLEATSIHGTIVQLMLLSQWIAEPDGTAKYNQSVARQVDDFRDFIRVHYMGDRRDTPFWQDVADSHPKHLLERVERWRRKIPSRGDFNPFPINLPHVEEQLYIPVLDGLGKFGQTSAKAALASNPKKRAALRKTHAELIREYKLAAGKCLPHRKFLNSLQQEYAA